MKKISLLAGILAAGMHYAQIKFEKGYFIDNSGTKKEVLIRNLDWKNNPVDFEYKTDNAGSVQKESIKNVQEFAVDGNSKYIRATVMVDRSSENLSMMSEDKAPDFKEETLFLKYIVEGKADLFYYENSNIRKYFYSTEEAQPKQLIYKPYYIDQGSVGYNEDYKKQIADHLKCGITGQQLQNLNYSAKDLTKIFIKYNECSGNQMVNYENQNTKKSFFHLNVRPGVNFSSFETTHNYSYEPVKTDFGSYTSFRIGLELEYVLPFNKNKWALFLEPTYQYYKGSKEITENAGSYFEYKYTATTDYKSIEVPMGVRHYFFLNDRSKIFVNAAYVLDFNLNSSIKFDRTELDVTSGNNFVFGAGFKYNDKFSAEVRVGTSRTLLRDYVSIDSNYKTVSLILGYTLF
ncbi:tRNA modification GTPase [Chryseobacterium lactis]|uniref:Autotransporter outer membrane beta-barrel domain-containing protein n=1 Tax=Chryseobacterium lactis TaxID=1241981 RepID=A0A3G6RE60_CHRLC|nr:autotransporter outer membrane beta-barrel domain-containing protein [Chryseobacterium lactis]AZA82723.1 autotransporter outer membrane beta-barrel domain-containing protein [Chryseobacterium lactis]AZB03105.1 autotransporter outer membrane beta-barrel domain-containing protein [Chryseobacterium lactis]PNW11756.1 tRNA modification GTPase [Chryseobacterium lactis]